MEEATNMIIHTEVKHRITQENTGHDITFGLA